MSTEATPVLHPPSEEPAGEDDRLAALVAERDDYLDTLQRVQAEFENFRKRVARQREADEAQAVLGVIDHLLPVFDALDRARAHHPDVLSPLDGVMAPAFVSLGVVRIEPLGEPFDAESHEAVAVDEDDAEAGAGGAATVVEVLRAGYRCRGQLLRPALVRVGPDSAASA